PSALCSDSFEQGLPVPTVAIIRNERIQTTERQNGAAPPCKARASRATHPYFYPPDHQDGIVNTLDSFAIDPRGVMIRRDQKMEPGLARRGDDLLDRAVTIVGEIRMGMKDTSEFGQSFQRRQHKPLAPQGHQGVSYG